jgi:putative ABC transport system permease protein
MNQRLLIRALFLGPLKRHPWRFLVALVGIGVGVASVVSTVASSRAAISSFTEGVDEVAGPALLEVTAPGRVPDTLLGDLRTVTRDAQLLPVIEEFAVIDEVGDVVRVLGLDLLASLSLRSLEREGDAVAPERLFLHPGLLIPLRLAHRLGVQQGQTITLVARSRPTPLEVLGVFRAPRLETVWDSVVIMDVATAQDLFGRQGELDRIEVLPRKGVEVQDVRSQIATLLPAGFQLAEPSRRRASAEQLTASLRFNLVALSGISLLVGAVLVATTLATSVVQRRQAIALLRSLGASRTQVTLTVAAEALGLGLLGGAIGVGAGLLGARASLDGVRATVAALVQGIPATTIRWEWELALGAVLLATLVSACASWLPLLEAMRTPPLQGLRSERPARQPLRSHGRSILLAAGLGVLGLLLCRLPMVGDLPLAALFGCLAIMAALMPISGPLVEILSRSGRRPLSSPGLLAPRLAAAALAAGRRRASWATGAVALAVALATAIATMVVSFRDTVVDWTHESLPSDIWVRPTVAATGVPTGHLDPEIVTIAEGLFGAEAVDPFYSVESTFGGRSITVSAAAFDVVQHHGAVGFRSGRPSREVFAEAYRRGGALINEPFARRFDVDAGDSITLPVPGGSITKEVVDVYWDYSRSQGSVVMDRTDLLLHYPELSPHEMAVFLPPDSDPAAARENLLAALSGRFRVEALLNRELRQEVLAVFDRTFAITTALAAVASLVAMLAVAAVLTALVGERTRELALLRSVGGSRPQLALMVLSQALMLGVAAAGIGIATGIVVGFILVKIVNLQSFGWSLQFLLPWSALARTTISVLVACALAALPPAWMAARLQPGEILREDA